MNVPRGTIIQLSKLVMEQIMETKDFLVSGERFSIRRDPDLDLLKTHPIPEDLGPYYNSDEYLSHKDSAQGFLAKLYRWVKNYNTSRKLRLIKRYAKNSRSLLDVGAGTGDLLVSAREAGFIAEGVEPNFHARELALKKGIHLKAELDHQNKFRIITLWHVLEHLKEPKEQIKQIKDLLEDEGTLFIAVPNFNSYDANYYKEYWAGYDVPRHVWHFSKSAIKKLFEDQQMKLVKTKPMPFDAFYISLLSEKYKHGKMRYLKAFYVGIISNLRAIRSGEYSSLLYILQKQH